MNESLMIICVVAAVIALAGAVCNTIMLLALYAYVSKMRASIRTILLSTDADEVKSKLRDWSHLN